MFPSTLPNPRGKAVEATETAFLCVCKEHYLLHISVGISQVKFCPHNLITSNSIESVYLQDFAYPRDSWLIGMIWTGTMQFV